MPFALIEKAIRQGQPHAAFAVRSMLAVCYAEKAIYEIPDDVLTAERVLQEVRDIERRLLFLDEGSPRPVLSVPHLLSSDSSAYYHGYVLAEMAVAQTRAFFEHRDGHLTDNRRIGADLRDSYWREGNRRRFGEFVERLTRRPLSADDMAQRVNREPDEADRRRRPVPAARCTHERVSTPWPTCPLSPTQWRLARRFGSSMAMTSSRRSLKGIRSKRWPTRSGHGLSVARPHAWRHRPAR